jgi:hypothetical protein
MAGTGGRDAARGFEYQYLKTLEQFLKALSNPDVASCRVEGDPQAITMGSADAVDYELIGQNESVFVASQVKSTRTDRTLSIRQVIDIFLYLSAGSKANSYRLDTNIRLSQEALDLKYLLDKGQEKFADLDAFLTNHSESLRGLIPTERGGRNFIQNILVKSRILYDDRSNEALRTDVQELIGTIRNAHQRGFGDSSAGLMTSYLTATVLRRAADPGQALWPKQDLATDLLISDDALIDALGKRDWGVVIGAMPVLPDLPRPVYLRKIHESLEPVSAANIGPVPCTILQGLSGIGKSSLAASYVGHYAHLYDQIYWIEASTRATIEASFRRIAARLPHRPADTEANFRDLVHEYLANSAHRWLMILDDMLDPELLKWVPRYGRGVVIITTTHGTLSPRAGWTLEIQRFKRGESISLLLNRLSVPKTRASREVLFRLAETFEDWPLALEVAAGYIRTCRIRLVEIPKYVEEIRRRAINDPLSVPTGYPRTLVAAIARTLEYSMRSLAHDPQALDRLTRGLYVAAHLASRQIPIHLLAVTEVPPHAIPEERGLYFLDSDSFSPHEFLRAMTSTSLVSTDKPLPEDSLSEIPARTLTARMNSITQQVLRLQEPERETLKAAAFHTECWLTAAHRGNDSEMLFVILPHAEQLAHHLRAMEVFSNEVSLLFGNIGSVYMDLNEKATAGMYLDWELGSLANTSSPNLVLSTQARLYLAMSYLRDTPRDQETSVLASELLEQVVEDLRQWAEEGDIGTNAAASLIGQISAILEEQPSPFIEDDRVNALRNSVNALRTSLPTTTETQTEEQFVRAEKLIRQQEFHLAVPDLLPLTQDNANFTMRLESTRLLCEAYANLGYWPETLATMNQFLATVGENPIHREHLERFIQNVGLALSGHVLKSDSPDAMALLKTLVASPQFDVLVRAAPPPFLSKLQTLQVMVGSRDPDPELSGSASVGVATLRAMLHGRSYDVADYSWAVLAEIAAIYRQGGLDFDAEPASEPPLPSEQGREQPLLGDPSNPIAGSLTGLGGDAIRYDPQSFIAAIENNEVESSLRFGDSPDVRLGKAEMTPAGVTMIVSEQNAAADAQSFPVLLVEPRKAAISRNTETGETREEQIEAIIAAGFQRMLYPSTGVQEAPSWKVSRISQTIRLVDADRRLWAEVRHVRDERWLSQARRLGWVLVIYGPLIGVRTPPGQDDYDDGARLEELRDARRRGLVAAGVVRWRE